MKPTGMFVVLSPPLLVCKKGHHKPHPTPLNPTLCGRYGWGRKPAAEHTEAAGPQDLEGVLWAPVDLAADGETDTKTYGRQGNGA